MQIQDLVASEEFMLPLSGDELVLITGGHDGKHRDPGPKHAKPLTAVGRALGIAGRVAVKASPVGRVASLAVGAYKVGDWYSTSSIHDKKGEWWSFL
jgi:hypothetical protein